MTTYSCPCGHGRPVDLNRHACCAAIIGLRESARLLAASLESGQWSFWNLRSQVQFMMLQDCWRAATETLNAYPAFCLQQSDERARKRFSNGGDKQLRRNFEESLVDGLASEHELARCPILNLAVWELRQDGQPDLADSVQRTVERARPQLRLPN